VSAAYELRNESYRGPALSATFHGRDIFAPAAAHLALGAEPSAFGPAVDDLIALEPSDVRVGDGSLEADVTRADWFGNLQLAATGVDLAGSGLSGAVAVNGTDAVLGEKFADVAEGELLVYVNSAGQVALACNRASARELLHDPDRVTLSAKT
jgi:S-adenosylmethionine hydrolase